MNLFLSHIHEELRRARLTRRGATDKAEDVPRGIHKRYDRMPHIALPTPVRLATTLADTLHKRRSADSGDPEIPVSLSEIGTLFGLALGKRANGSRNYPSGGALYPIETYLISTALESETPGVFHYNPTEHALERLLDLPDHFDMKSIARHPESLPLSSLIVFTSLWHRSSAKYGDLTYQHALIEAGHMSENILLVACALGLGVRPYAGFEDDRIAELLDLEEGSEQTVHTITLCKGVSDATNAEAVFEN
ncbi:MAG TPA: SagB/ThcOx family dehydrogenase [Candidatus Paceibacterota bacterium]|nr:SagB/ThcOx family dehydrogenase [Candidatus Paceibacterota bacterium]